jgi:AraC-like DNA-binding protein
MKSYSIPLSRIDDEDNFKHLTQETGGELEEENAAIRFSGTAGRGCIKKWHLDAGLYMRVWDLVLTTPVELLKEASPAFVTNNGFSLLCILTPGSVGFKSINQHQQFNKLREKSFALMPDTVNAAIQAYPQTPVQFIDFTISSYWFKQQPGHVKICRYFNHGLMEETGVPVLVEPCSGKNSHTAGKLFNCLAEKNSDITGMLSLAVSLITGFLACTSLAETDKTSCSTDLYLEKVKEVETILMVHLQKTLPRLSSIAQKVALSESTLKRHFKLIYGKSIYEYYLNKKMEVARDLLLQKLLTVNETAEIMGYEKVSNFIDIFKKHHGYSPGSLKKKQFDQV